MKSKIFLIIVITILTLPINAYSQSKKDTLTFAFWNMENLFDTVDDPNKNDTEFTPEGSKNWTEEKLKNKLSNMAKVIKLMGDRNGPDILGVSEVEHQSLVDLLIKNYLKEKDYGVAYKESPDRRGIDNGLIFNKKLFSLISVKSLHVELPSHYPTRDILEVHLKSFKGDSLIVFVNHWPSRRGGQKKSEKNRLEAANTLQKRIEEITNNKKSPNILIIGDFNDTPTNKSIREILDANPIINVKKFDNNLLYNLSYLSAEKGLGTMKYRKKWYDLDQIIVSNSMLNNIGFQYLISSFRIFKPNILVQKTGRYKGTAFPTFGGRKYLGGYSDHFPVLAKFILN